MILVFQGVEARLVDRSSVGTMPRARQCPIGEASSLEDQTGRGLRQDAEQKFGDYQIVTESFRVGLAYYVNASCLVIGLSGVLIS